MDIKPSDGKYQVESEHKKGTFYTVDITKPSCTCQGFLFYARRKGGVCKHIRAVQEQEEQKNRGMNNEIIAYVAEHEEVETAELIEKFSEKAVDMLIQRGELIEKRGKIRILQ